MKKLVILQFYGDFSTGYKVTLEVGEEGKRPDLRIRGELPQAIDIIQCFQSWRDIYRSLDGQTRIKKLGARNVNIDDLKQKCDERSQNLLNSFNSWLQSQSFNPIINCLCKQDWDREDEIRVILSTDCQELRKLPWHLWNGFYAIPYFRIRPLEVALSAPDGERRERPFREKIRILIILGDSTGINVKADEQLLQQYCGDAEIVTLVEPLRMQLQFDAFENLVRKDVSLNNLWIPKEVRIQFVGINLKNAKLSRIEWEYKNFSGAYLYQAKLYRANISHAKLNGTFLYGADLTEANLTNSDLKGASLYNANINGTNFKGAKNLTIEQVKSAKNWRTAKYDNNFRAKLGLLVEKEK